MQESCIWLVLLVSFVIDCIAIGIDPHSPEAAFAAVATHFKTRGEQLFGKAFIYEQEMQTAQASFVNIRRCFFNDFITANGAPELTPVVLLHGYAMG
jgi:hypothetical protein